MPKIKRNKQFVENEERIRTYLSDRKLSPNKVSLKIEEFEGLLDIAKVEAECRELEPSQFIRWLLWRFLSARGKINVQIDKYKPRLMTFEELGFANEHDCNMAMKREQLQRGEAVSVQ
jgi:hypothetical protein